MNDFGPLPVTTRTRIWGSASIPEQIVDLLADRDRQCVALRRTVDDQGRHRAVGLNADLLAAASGNLSVMGFSFWLGDLGYRSGWDRTGGWLSELVVWDGTGDLGHWSCAVVIWRGSVLKGEPPGGFGEDAGVHGGQFG